MFLKKSPNLNAFVNFYLLIMYIKEVHALPIEIYLIDVNLNLHLRAQQKSIIYLVEIKRLCSEISTKQ